MVTTTSLLIQTTLLFLSHLTPISCFVRPQASSHHTIPPLSAMTSLSTNDNLSIGPSSLRTLLQTASQSLLQNEKHGLDLNGIVWMEHLNLVVGSMDAARAFYVEFLGCTVDENEKHFNLGQQQVGLSCMP
jgi:hypothetical protein